MKDSAPVAIFAFNRPLHVERLFETLATNPESVDSRYFIFCDGPRSTNDDVSVRQTRDVVDRFARTHQCQVFKQPANQGLAKSIIRGIDTVLKEHDRFIVLEDDLVVSRHFLRFVNRSLDVFRDRPEIGCVSGFMYPTHPATPRAVLLPFVTSWGWATWADRWQAYNPDGAALASQIERAGRRREFDLGGSFHCWGMLQDQIYGYSSSWWIRWYATLFLRNQLSVWPGVSLLLNAGMDGSGTHCGESLRYEGVLADVDVEIDTGLTAPSAEYLNAIKAFLAPTRHSDILLAVRRHIPRRFFHQVLRPFAKRFVG